MRLFLPLTGTLILFGARVLAAGFDRPVPQAPSAMAEIWSVAFWGALVLSTVAVQRQVPRR